MPRSTGTANTTPWKITGASTAPTSTISASPSTSSRTATLCWSANIASSSRTSGTTISVSGKAAMASIKLKGSLFKSPPEVAAMVSKRENKYYITQQDKHANVKVNGDDASQGQHALDDGDIIEVAGVKMSFAWHE